MQCTVCHKTLATVHVLDLENGSVIDEQSLCPTCAESAGYVHPKAAPLKISPEILEDLLGGMKSSPTSEVPETGDACPACGLTANQFRSRGRLGCPRCYEMFRDSLLPLLERVHDGTSHRGRCPRKSARMAGEDDRLADLRSSLQDAITAENYELAADLRDQIQELSRGEESAN
jgi:protein arginine kinase activator